MHDVPHQGRDPLTDRKLTLLVVLGIVVIGWCLAFWTVAASVGLGLLAVGLSLWGRGLWDGRKPGVGEDQEWLIKNLRDRLADRTRLLEEAYLDMQSLDRVKETFLSNLSHEMRTPLTSIMAAEEILSGYADESPETREEFLNIIHQESNRLLSLMGKLLDLVKLEAKALRLDCEQVDITALVDKTAASILNQRPDLTTSIEIEEPGVSVWCECDRERIARVLHSMIENALRYSPSGGRVSVSISVARENVLVAMEDAGERSDHRFTDMFEGECVDRGAAPAIPFLGHPIAERLAGLHGGSLTPASSESGGTIVTLRLPVRQPGTPAGAPELSPR